MKSVEVGDVYERYDGCKVFVVALARHTESKRKMVIFTSLPGFGVDWKSLDACPLVEFHRVDKWDGRNKRAQFVFVRSSKKDPRAKGESDG